MPPAAYDALQTLSRLLNLCPPPARITLAHLALRAALHSDLRPYLLDPLLPLDGQFVSLDAQLAAIQGFADTHGIASRLLSGLPPDDRRALGVSSVSDPPPSPEPAIGTIWGALYLPWSGAAVSCHVRAAYAPSSEESADSGWPEPVAVRPVGPEVAASARAALAAAIHTIENSALLDAPLWPAPVFYDVCAPDLDEADLQRIAGDSLGLPLALAFLSAMAGAPLPARRAATGAVAKLPRRPDAVTPVGWVVEKAAALRFVAEGLLAPPPLPDPSPLLLTAVETVGQAARALGIAIEPAAPAASLPPAKATPPTGRITLVFTEIVGATPLWESAPAAMREAQSDHNRIVQEQLARHGGYVFQTTDAGFGAAFAEVADACHAALSLQRALHAHLWPAATGPLRVRAGIHQGDADLFRGEYFGPLLPQTRRLMAAAHGGQILLSDTARAGLSEADLAAEWHLLPLGTHRLRDLSEPLRLFQLSCPPLPARFDPPRTLDSGRHNLPVQWTPLLGRDEEVGRLLSLIRSGERRLVTLTGPGGVGKTRLALQVAAEAMESFADGVWFVPLSEAQNASDVVGQFAQALGLGVAGDPLARVREALQSSQMLLVLDNFENVLEGAALVMDLLASAPGVTCLVTSRALLQIRGEQRFEVLALPTPVPEASDADAYHAPAVALFRERARVADLGWTLAPEDLPYLREICRRLEGLPLAIELAAARIRTLSLGQIASRLEESFDLLATRLRDVPERHRTLQATLEWSYQLLEEDERRLLARLSVFAGTFTAEAAEAVGDDPGALDTTLDLLAGLEEKSLVVCRVEGDTSRYRLMQMVREFAAGKLKERGDDAVREAHNRHARFFAQRAQRLGAAANTDNEVAAFDALAADIENVRAAALWLRDHDPAAIPVAVAAAAEFLQRRGRWRERVEWLRAALALAPKDDPRLRIRLQLDLAVAESDTGDHDAAWNRLESARDAAEVLGDVRLAAEALHHLGREAGLRGEPEQADALLNAALERFRSAGDPPGVTRVLVSLGEATALRGNDEAARARFEEALPLLRARGDARGLTIALNHLGRIVHAHGDDAAARALFGEQLEQARRIKDAPAVAEAMLNLGTLERERGDTEAAVPLLAAAERLFFLFLHADRERATAQLALCEPAYGADRLRKLRDDLTRRSTEHLQRADSLVRRVLP